MREWGATHRGSSALKITLHEYATDPSLPQKDGVNLAHENIATLARQSDHPSLQFVFHDFVRLISDRNYALSVLSACDCVIANVGPHAHFYFWLREQLELSFIIISDVRTAIWSSYLHQESLCQPLRRPGDILLIASNYTRGIYEHLFPHLKAARIVHCYPLAVSFPLERPRKKLLIQSGQPLTLGYVGRLSADKNFADILTLLICLEKKFPGKYRLKACGDIHTPTFSEPQVRQYLVAQLGHSECYDYLPARSNTSIWPLYSDIDILLFPSTSNLETLGRVLVEASYARVPVVTGAHAAATELVPKSSLCRVEYTTKRVFDTHHDHPLGRVNVDDMARVITGDQLVASNCYDAYAHHDEKLLELLLNLNNRHESESLALTNEQQHFIASLQVTMPASTPKQQTIDTITMLAQWFIALQNIHHPHYQRSLETLLERSSHRDRTEQFIAKSQRTRGDFTNVGGIDIELCHLTNFYPSFYIKR